MGPGAKIVQVLRQAENFYTQINEDFHKGMNERGPEKWKSGKWAVSVGNSKTLM